MSIAYPARRVPARPAPSRLSNRVAAWLATRRERRIRRRTERELAELPPYLLRDVGLVDLAHAREGNGGRTLDHAQPICAALSSWSW